jgi:hypothetical protein
MPYPQSGERVPQNGQAGPASVRDGRPGCAAVAEQILYAAGYPWTGR